MYKIVSLADLYSASLLSGKLPLVWGKKNYSNPQEDKEHIQTYMYIAPTDSKHDVVGPLSRCLYFIEQ